MYNRISIKTPEGRFEVRDRSFSQTVEMLKGLDKETTEGFWHKKVTTLVDGCIVKLVIEGV